MRKHHNQPKAKLPWAARPSDFNIKCHQAIVTVRFGFVDK
jgi:hypothetical protein